MLCEITTDDFAAALDAVVLDILAEAGVTGPPVDALTVAGALGIAVATDDRQAGRARYVRLGGHRSQAGRAAILLRSDPRSERRQWAIAHEIGEHMAHRVFAALDVDPAEAPKNARETAANHLAARLLLPSEWFQADGTNFGWDLLLLKRHYATASHEMIVRRMLQCTPPIIVTIFDQNRKYFRQSNVPGGVPSLSPAEEMCRKVVHRENRPEHAHGDTLSIQGWPVHEKDWKREILRTELLDVW